MKNTENLLRIRNLRPRIAGMVLAMLLVPAGAGSAFAAQSSTSAENTSLAVENASWDGTSGTGSWTDNTSARYYQVKLYRNETSVMSTVSVYDNSYDFSSHMTRRGNYYFMVRAVGSGSAKGEWASSDTMFLTAEEADDISYDSRHSYSGGPGDGKYVSGGPGDTGKNPASTGAMLVNSRTPDGCYVGGDGAWIQ